MGRKRKITVKKTSVKNGRGTFSAPLDADLHVHLQIMQSVVILKNKFHNLIEVTVTDTNDDPGFSIHFNRFNRYSTTSQTMNLLNCSLSYQKSLTKKKRYF